jgi:hypothetical protein
VLKFTNVSWNWTIGSGAFVEVDNVTLTKSLDPNVTASGSDVRKPERVTPLELVTMLFARIAPFTANLIGATRTPSANTSKPVLPASCTVKVGAA